MMISTREKITYGWSFCKRHLESATVPVPSGCEESGFPAMSEYKPVRIPHDWMIENAEDLYENSIGWYRYVLYVDENNQSEWKSMVFDGVYMDSSIFVNHCWVMDWKYGYSAFEVPLHPYLKAGENEILVRVVYRNPNSRWYSGAGIFRNVHLVSGGAIHIRERGIYIHSDRVWDTSKDCEMPSENKDNACYETEIRVELDSLSLQKAATEGMPTDNLPKDGLTMEATVLSEGQELFSGKNLFSVTDAVSGGFATVRLHCESVEEWSLQNPKLYCMRVRVLDSEGVICDEREIAFGYRSIAFDPDCGFWLNGEHVKLQGVCVHHDHGALGAGVNVSSIRRRLRLLRRMGVNAIRCAHNMPSSEFLALCDEQGFLVMDEAFDCWEMHKTDYDYAGFFEEWHEKDMQSFVERDRNHPCVILWSVGNEIADTHAGERGMVVMKRLMELVERFDPLHNAAVTLASNYMAWENTQKCADVIKLIGYNYTERLYEEHHQAHPDWIIYGSETSSVVYSRGIYHFPMERDILADDDEQCSSLGNSITSWGAKSVEAAIIAEKKASFSMGQFLWSGFDYIGEPTPYHTRNSYFGQLDTAGFPKDAYYMFRAGWTDGETDPFVHIFPHWDFNIGQQVDVRVCSNTKRVKLWLNDELIGETDELGDSTLQYGGSWIIPYRPGVLRAEGYDAEGRVVARAERHSYGDPVRLRARVEGDSFWNAGEKTAEGDCAFICIEALDADGHVVENAVCDCRVSVTGAGRLAALDNGDSTDRIPYRSCHRRMFSGKLLAVVEHTGEPGDVTVIVESPNTDKISLVINETSEEKLNSELTNKTQRVQYELQQDVCQDELAKPVRKIELVRKESILSPDLAVGTVEARIHPTDYYGGEIQFRVCDDNGVDSPIASIEETIFPKSGDECEDTITIRYRAKGDGVIRIRGMWKEDNGRVSALSQIECVAEGFGKCNMDPYSFVSASLCTKSGGEITSGNERGIATGREDRSYVVYENLDFGDFGATDVTLPIFPFAPSVPIWFWNGVPHEAGSRIIGRAEYTKPMVWNTYVEDTFHLDEPLVGISTFALEFDTKVHLKGFWFAKRVKAYAELKAAQADRIYGDSYTLDGDCVRQIGNNVTLEFEHMDFGSETSTRIDITGSTTCESNSIRLLVSGDTEYTEDLRFEFSEAMTTRTFAIPAITGDCKIQFVFMPGSRFDFAAFRFERRCMEWKQM